MAGAEQDHVVEQIVKRLWASHGIAARVLKITLIKSLRDHTQMALFNFTRAVEVSGNEKTGAVSTTYVSQASCPKECAFFNEGCYAESGMAGIWTNRLNAQVGGKTALIDARQIARDEAKAVDSLTGQNDLRLHVVGDCRTAGAASIVSKAAERFMGKFGRRMWFRR
jgi:hypothetical protein